MTRYIITTVATAEYLHAVLNDDTVTEADVPMDIMSTDGQPLLFDHRIDAEDFMDVADVSEEMVVIEAPADLQGIIIT